MALDEVNPNRPCEIPGSPVLAEDGSHVIPLRQLRCAGHDSCADATGELRWHPERGVTLTVQFPNVSGALLPRYFGRQKRVAVEGRFRESATTPDWFGETSDGLSFAVCSLNETPVSTTETNLAGSRDYSRVDVEVISACVDLPKGSPLGFWHQTPPETRMLCLGFGSSAWHKTERVTYEHDGGETTTGRGTIDLCSTPHVRLVSAGNFNLPHDVKACWVVSDELSEGLEYANRTAKAFISFLNGRRTPFYWHDAFESTEHLRRTYYGEHKIPFDQLHTSYSQPLPLYGTVDAIQHAKEVVPKLPALFAEFVRLADDMRLTFILNPLWSASRAILDDQFALACISLERLAAAWQRKSQRKKDGPFFSPAQLAAIRDAMTGALKLVSASLNLNAGQETVLAKRIQNVGERPNVDKLSLVFTELGIELTASDREVIKQRNTPFHGSPTLGDPNDLADLNNEAARFHRLQMLVTKAVLLLLKYRGPFVNHAAVDGVRVDVI